MLRFHSKGMKSDYRGGTSPSPSQGRHRDMRRSSSARGLVLSGRLWSLAVPPCPSLWAPFRGDPSPTRPQCQPAAKSGVGVSPAWHVLGGEGPLRTRSDQQSGVNDEALCGPGVTSSGLRGLAEAPRGPARTARGREWGRGLGLNLKRGRGRETHGGAGDRGTAVVGPRPSSAPQQWRGRAVQTPSGESPRSRRGQGQERGHREGRTVPAWGLGSARPCRPEGSPDPAPRTRVRPTGRRPPAARQAGRGGGPGPVPAPSPSADPSGPPDLPAPVSSSVTWGQARRGPVSGRREHAQNDAQPR